MKKHLKRIEDDIASKMYMFEGMIKNFDGHVERIEKKGKDPEVELLSKKIMLAEFYMMWREVKQLIHILNLIYNRAVSELNGTYYEDHEKQWDGVDGIKYNPEKDNLFQYILNCFDNDNFKMSDDLKNYIELSVELNLTLQKGMFKFIPEMEKALITVDTAGNAQPSTKEAMHQQTLKEDYETQCKLLEGYNSTIEKLKHLAETKGNIAEIIRLVE